MLLSWKDSQAFWRLWRNGSCDSMSNVHAPTYALVKRLKCYTYQQFGLRFHLRRILKSRHDRNHATDFVVETKTSNFVHTNKKITLFFRFYTFTRFVFAFSFRSKMHCLFRFFFVCLRTMQSSRTHFVYPVAAVSLQKRAIFHYFFLQNYDFVIYDNLCVCILYLTVIAWNPTETILTSRVGRQIWNE